MGSRTDRANDLVARVIASEDNKPQIKIEFSIANDQSVKVIRKTADFVFSLDNMSYFSGMSPEDGRVIFEGIPQKQGKFVELCDNEVEIGTTYAYFVICDSSPGSFVGPAAVKVRDPYIFWSHSRILEKCEKLASEHGGRLVDLGESVGHKRLCALSVGNPNKTVALIGAVHAGEAGAELCLSVLEMVARERRDLFDRVGIIALPSVNADGREQVVCGHPAYIRKNRNGIDINRNFDANWKEIGTSYGTLTSDERSSTYRGPYPASEPETRAVVRLIEELRPTVAISYHHVSSITGDSMYAARMAESDSEYVKRAEHVARLYKTGFREPIGYPMNKTVFYSGSSGGFPAYCYKHGIVGFDVEHWASDLSMFNGSKGDEPTRKMLDLCVKCHASALIKLLENMD